MAKLKTHLLKLMLKKAKDENRIINKITVAREAGVARSTIDNWLRGDLKRIDEPVVVALCRYFKCGLTDLVDIDWEGERNGNAAK